MPADSAIYTWDNLGRLKTILFANATLVTFYYDAAGNRTSVVATCSGAC